MMLTFRFTGADGVMTASETITTGMMGKQVKLEFSEEWKDLNKTAVFTAGVVTRDVVGVEDVVVIPAEVLEKAGQSLYVGVYGTDADGTVAIPTIRVQGPLIQPGASPSGDPSTMEDLPVWAQIQAALENLRREGLQGFSVYYADFHIRTGIDTVLLRDVSEIQTQGRGLMVGDLLISRNGVLLQVVKIDGDTYDAKRITSLIPELDGADDGVEDVADLLGYGSVEDPIDLGSLTITDHTTLSFSKGTYYVSPLDLQNLSHVTIRAEDAVLMVQGTHFLTGENCPWFRMVGGVVDGQDQAVCGVELRDSNNSCLDGVTFRHFGSAQQEDVSMVRLFGDCTDFLVEQCVFQGCHAGVVSSDGFIHAYGLFINRLGSSKTYSKSGIVRQCTFQDIAGVDTASVKADGDGIFIQAPPYLNDAGETIIPNAQILIQNCRFTNCKKRGVKSAVWGVTVEDCAFQGEFWYACMDFQYGHGRVLRSVLENTSAYNGSITSALVISDGGVELQDCTLRAAYLEAGTNRQTFHPGIRMGKRLASSIFGSQVHWDTIRMDNCYFDGCSRSVFAYNSEGDATGYTLDGLEITNCRFGMSNHSHTVELNATMFQQILVYKLVDFRYDDGIDRKALAAVNSSFVYPHTSNCAFVHAFELHSRYWENEPMSGYKDLPTATHTRILYEGSGMGTIVYKEYTGGGSLIRGSQNPASVTATLSKQLLYNSRVGDLYINTATGAVLTCTAAGTDSTIGTWTILGTGA